MFSRIPAGVGPIFVGLAILVVVYLKPEAATAPLWMVVAAAFVFIFAGCGFTARSLGRERLSNFVFVGAVYAMAALFIGLTFMPGTVPCKDDRGRPQPESQCRTATAIGSLVLIGFAVPVTINAFRRRPASEPVDKVEQSDV